MELSQTYAFIRINLVKRAVSRAMRNLFRKDIERLGLADQSSDDQDIPPSQIQFKEPLLPKVPKLKQTKHPP